MLNAYMVYLSPAAAALFPNCVCMYLSSGEAFDSRGFH